jgi:hypothetical protein
VRATTIDVSKRVRMEMNMFKGKVTKNLMNWTSVCVLTIVVNLRDGDRIF